MGCIDFWAINSLLGSAMFFIVFLMVEGQPEYLRLEFADKDKAVVALVMASVAYGVIGVVLLLWQIKRQRRIEQALLYRLQVGKQQSIKG